MPRFSLLFYAREGHAVVSTLRWMRSNPPCQPQCFSTTFPIGAIDKKKRRHLPMRIRSLAALLVLALFCVALGNRPPARADAEKKNVTAEIESLKAAVA